MTVARVSDADRLRIAVLGDFDGVHTRSWIRWFIERGHDVHAISFYPPGDPLGGANLHALHQRATLPPGASTARSSGRRLPAGPVRLLHGARYWQAGLKRVLRDIKPDVFHAHFIVEHGFYGALAGVHPYVVTAWGSDVLVEPQRDPVSKQIAKWTLRHADLATSNNAYMAERMIALGAPRDRVAVITLGADREFLDAGEHSVNLVSPVDGRAPTILSTRAHEPLYNVGKIIEAYDHVARRQPDARLVIAHSGSLTEALSRRAAASAGRIEMLGFIDAVALRGTMSDAEIFVSIPTSDGTSVALLQAMASGCFPVVSDLPTQRELIDDGVNGFRVPLHRPDILADRLKQALADAELRRSAAVRNRQIVEERGLNEHEMAKLERLYLNLARNTRSTR